MSIVDKAERNTITHTLLTEETSGFSKKITPFWADTGKVKLYFSSVQFLKNQIYSHFTVNPHKEFKSLGNLNITDTK